MSLFRDGSYKAGSACSSKGGEWSTVNVTLDLSCHFSSSIVEVREQEQVGRGRIKQ